MQTSRYQQLEDYLKAQQWKKADYETYRLMITTVGKEEGRGFTQDDAHLFCTEDQVGEEFKGCIEMTQMMLRTMGLNDYRVRLSFRDPRSEKYIGKPESWNKAERAIEEVA